MGGRNKSEHLAIIRGHVSHHKMHFGWKAMRSQWGTEDSVVSSEPGDFKLSTCMYLNADTYIGDLSDNSSP